ncbi:hypothetical protein BJV82DRAFT_566552, partial [Fennellomyces sp. T-0311]
MTVSADANIIPKPNALPYYVIRFPSNSTIELSQDTLIQENHKEHDMFFINARGYYNHLTHHYLAAYSLGATKERLQEIYNGHKNFLRPMPPAVGEFTEENYRVRIDNHDAYTSYLNFFKSEIEELGMMKAVTKWLFKDDMLARFLGGVYHPLIHLGYAIEFGLETLAVESLAMAACTEGDFAPLMNLTGSTAPIPNGTEDVHHLVVKMRNDKTFDDVVKFKDPRKIDFVLSNDDAKAKIREYATQWNCPDPGSGLQELYTTAMILFGATGIRDQGIKLDFCFMHTLTSIHAVHTLMPYLTPIQGELLLRGHLATTLAYYVARGRPSFHINALMNYESPTPAKSNNPWFNVLDRAIGSEEVHIITVVRALALGQMVYGRSFAEAWIRAAQITLDVIGPTCTSVVNADWNIAGIGFEDAWQ